MKDYDYLPDNWVLIKTPHCCKVLAGWKGGYTTGDAWKLNSGISKVEEDEDFWYFSGVTGSVYACHKERNGISMAFSHIYKQMIDAGCVEITVEEVECLD
jgi:hypothetical protein